MTPKKPVNGKTTFPPIPPEPKKPRTKPPRGLQVDANAPASIELLNSAVIFQRRIKFEWIRRRGEIIQAGFSDGRTAQWLSATDLRTFARSQDILFNATDFLIPTPSKATITDKWEPVAQAIRDVAKLDAIEAPPPLKDEFEYIIRTTWNRSGCPKANNREEFFSLLLLCQMQGREHDSRVPPRACVWVGGNGESANHHCWIYQEALVDWLSTLSAKSKHYPWDDVRKALRMLDFENVRVHSTLGGKEVKVRLWRGPEQLLSDQDEADAPCIEI